MPGKNVGLSEKQLKKYLFCILMESESEYITVCDGVHIYDQEIGFASKKIKEQLSNIRPQEDQKSCSRNPAENSMALRQAPLLSSVPQTVQYRFLKSLNLMSFTFLTALCELKGTPSGQVSSAGVVVYRNWYKYWNYSSFSFQGKERNGNGKNDSE